jgi:uncharacterized protein YjbI with pentapeptide repeats
MGFIWSKREFLIFLLCIGMPVQVRAAFNPFNAASWESLGSDIQSAGEWFGKQVVDAANAVADAVGSAGIWLGDQATIAFEKAKSATDTIYTEAIAPAGQAFEEVGKIIVEHANTKVTRAADYAVRYAALQAAYGVATGVLEAAQAIARGTLEATYQTAYGSLKAAEGFLAEVVKPTASGVLVGAREAGNGILEGAKEASLGALEGGKWVVNNTLGQIDLNRIHYDGNLQDFATGILGNVEFKGKIIAPFDFKATLDVSDVFASIKQITNKLVDDLEEVFIKPFKKKTGYDANRALLEEQAREAEKIKNTLAAMQPPVESIHALEDMTKKEKSWQVALQFDEQLAEAEQNAQEAKKEMINPEEFFALPPQEKIAQVNKLEPEAKANMIKINVELLKKNKTAPGAYFENLTLEGIDISGGNIQGAVFNGVTFNTVNASGTNMDRCVFVNCTFNNCNGAGAKINGALIAALSEKKQTTFNNCNLSKAHLRETKLNAQLNSCNLDELDGVGLDVRFTWIRGNTTLRKANLQWMEANELMCDPRIDMTQVDLRNAILVEVTLNSAILTQAHLENATIVYSRLSMITADGADMEGTQCVYGVNMRGANIAKAVTINTNFQGANLCGALMPDGKVNEKGCNQPVPSHAWQMEGEIVTKNVAALLANKKCTQCMLENADVRGKNLSGFDLSNAWMVGADLRGTNFSNANLRGARLLGAKIDGATSFAGAQFCRTLMPDGTWSNDACGKPGPTEVQVPTQEADVKTAPTHGIASAQAQQNKEKLLKTRACPGCDLKYVDLKEAQLNEVNLEGANLMGTHLEGASLNNANLNNADMQRAKMQGISLSGQRTTLIKANVKNADLGGASIDRADLTGAKLFKANLEGADLNKAILKHVNLSHANLKNADVERADLTGANLIGADVTGIRGLDKAILCNTLMPDGTISRRNCPQEAKAETQTPLSKVETIRKQLRDTKACPGCTLTQAMVDDIPLVGINFAGANLSGLDLHERDLTDANLTDAVLRETNLNGATLIRTDLTKAVLISAKLNKAQLIEATLIKADMTNAELEDAVLNKAKMRGADMSGAVCIRAELPGADMTDATLTQTNFTGANLANVLFDGALFCKTIMTDGKENNKDCQR